MLTLSSRAQPTASWSSACAPGCARPRRLPPRRRGVCDVAAVGASAPYRELVERLRTRIRESQTRAARTLNTELVMLYWSIGREILGQQQASGWGDDVDRKS